MKDNDWKGKDKPKHIGVCLVLAVLCPPLAVCAALCKEWMDKKSYGHWCWWDIAADAVGVAVGTGVWWTWMSIVNG